MTGNHAATNAARRAEHGRRRAVTPAFVLLASLWTLAAPLPAAAADIRVNATLDRESAAIGEEVTLTVTVEGARGGSAPVLPELLAFTVFGAGSSQNISIVNGNFQSSQTFSYVLVPLRSGAQTIGAIEVERGGRIYKTAPLTLTVGAAGGGPGRGGAGGTGGAPGAGGVPRGEPGSGAPVNGRAGDPMFLTASLSKDHAVVNEEVVLTIRFYRRVDPVDTPEYTPPALTGFWVEDLPPQRSYYDTVNGIEYMVTELQTAIFPTAPGRLTVGSASLRCQIRESERGRPSEDPFTAFQRGIFGDMFGRIRPVAVKSRPLTLDVEPLPAAGKPAGFAGVVGEFTLKAELDPPQVPAGEPATLRIRMRGQGNVKSLPEVTLPAIPGVRVYDGKGSLEVSKEGYRVSGTRVVEKVLVPGTTGHYIVPPVSVSVYRPGHGYTTLRSDTLVLVATASRAPLAGGGGVGGAPQAIAEGERDIRHIRSDAGRLTASGRGALSGPLFAILQILPLVAVGAAVGYRVERRRRARNPAGFRSRMAAREARRRLVAARAAASSGDLAATAAAVARGLTGFLGDRMNLEIASLTPLEAAGELRSRGVDEATVDRVAACLGKCDLARFAPSAPGLPGAAELVDDARAAIEALEGRDLTRTAAPEPAEARP